MSPRDSWCIGRTLTVRAAALALLALLGVASVRGDDRDLLRSTIADPYLAILLDTSGSMNWSPKGSACTTGDCYVPLQSDDPSSKFYQAKQALYEVLTDPTLPKVYLGFSTYNQDQLAVNQKHWLYQATSNGVSLGSGAYYPQTGAQDVFGTLWSCDTGNNDNEIGCYGTTPADVTDSWELGRVQRLPKGGVSYSQSQTFYIRRSGTTYRVIYQPSGGSYGGNLTVKVTVSRCNNSSCSSNTSLGSTNVSFALVSDFVGWDLAVGRTNPQLGYFPQATATDSAAGNTCSGWDPNTDVSSDKYPNSSGYDVRWPTDSSDPRGTSFTVGDVIPLDWTADHKVDILKRLAPNYVNDSTVPDFRVATYFRDTVSGSDSYLRLKDENQRPIIATGSTPLGASVQQFRTWYSGCSSDTCSTLGGWAKIAAMKDPSFECRQKFLLILTDGDESCGGDPCKYTQLLHDQYGVTTFVVAFGVTAAQGNKLSCMADASHLFYPQDKDELVADLKTVLGAIREQASTFASAAVPSVQADVADRIYLSNFTPLNDASIWDGHIDAYLKPLPLTSDGKPDKGRTCPPAGTPDRASCHLWDAGEVILSQAPTVSDLSSGVNQTSLRLGTSEIQRRVFYGKSPATAGTVPTPLRLFYPPSGDPKNNPTPDWSDLLNGLKVPLPVTAADSTSAKTRVNNIIAKTLEIKTATVQVAGEPDRTINYVLGDIFHADPVLVDKPNNIEYYGANLYSNSTTDCTSNPGYQCFAKKYNHRRKMLLVGTNDGQLHAFDGGLWDGGTKLFTDGSGKEIFSYIPRLTLPVVRSQAEGTRQIYGVDGSPYISDVYIDPAHNGTPTASQREWRTVAVGGFREGGGIDGGSRMTDFTSGYYALDVTQPDKLDSNNDPISTAVVPTCVDAQNNTVSGCGTLPFPSVLWEYSDAIGTSQLDEDRNGYADLGQTWSVPIVGRIKVIEGGVQVDKFVAIFGGGMDADNKLSPKRGTWLYMVDVETGQTIYKRKLVGAAAANPAVLDKDLNGYLDTIYMGTTAGFLYKVDISSPGTLQNVSLATNQAVPALATGTTVKRITDTSWDPFPIFDTQSRPIYEEPSIIYVSKRKQFALAFGTGDRENLWSLSGVDGRFYVAVDDNFTAAQVASGQLPKTESSYQAIDITSSDVSSTTDFLNNPATGKSPGWFMKLESDERVITQSFGLTGIIIFSGFQPQDVGSDPDNVCARGGISHLYVVSTTNANSLLKVGGSSTRFLVVPKFVTNPYIEQGSTSGSGSGSGSGGSGGTNSEQPDPTLDAVTQQLKSLLSPQCKFGNVHLSVSTITSETGHVSIARVPVCTILHNWKEQ